MATQVVRAKDTGWLMRMHVAPESRVTPGDPLYDWIPEDGAGVHRTVSSPDFGIVKAFDGADIFYSKASASRRVKRGEAMFVIAEPLKKREVAGDKGLIPRPTRVIARRNARKNALH